MTERRTSITLTETAAGWLVQRQASTVTVGPYALPTALRAAGCLARRRDVSAAALDPDELGDIAEALAAEAVEARP